MNSARLTGYQVPRILSFLPPWPTFSQSSGPCACAGSTLPVQPSPWSLYLNPFPLFLELLAILFISQNCSAVNIAFKNCLNQREKEKFILKRVGKHKWPEPVELLKLKTMNREVNTLAEREGQAGSWSLSTATGPVLILPPRDTDAGWRD